MEAAADEHGKSRRQRNNSKHRPVSKTTSAILEDPETVYDQIRLYENWQHLSARERDLFEQRFTKPKTRSQEIYASMLRAKSKKIILATGPAGTGKTLFATEHGIRYFLQGQCEKLVFTRPSVSVDEDLGYLPGTLEDKMAPWVRPIYDILYQHMSVKDVTALLEEKVIEIAPLGYMRGRTFKNCWIVADEMQNATVAQMKMLLTRVGENSRLVVTGDLEQHDRVLSEGGVNGLEDFLDKFRGKRSSSIGSFEFDRSDIQREEVVKEILDIYGGDIPTTYKEEDEDEDNATGV
jgi:phosphate starvation-inducible protein PhoH